MSSVRWHPTKDEPSINDSHKAYDTTINCHQPMATKVAPTMNIATKIAPADMNFDHKGASMDSKSRIDSILTTKVDDDEF